MTKKLLLFVHGLGGSPQATWGDFESILRSDTDLQGMEVGYFSYPTFLLRLPFGRRYPGVQTLASALSTQIENRFAHFEDITLVCHSLGGLICKQYLVDCVDRDQRLRVKRALLYAVPNNGAALASIADYVSWRHGQLRQLCRESDLVRQLSYAWARNKIESLVDIRYVIAALDRVVDEHSARQTWENAKVDVIADKGHIDIVKPQNAEDLSYLVLKNHIVRTYGLDHSESIRTSSAKLASGPSNESQYSDDAFAMSTELRIAVSATLRVERDGKYLLVRNLHRPETFAPFGGVYKFLSQARAKLDEFSFRPQAIDVDMRHGIRGFISRNSLPAFREWFSAGIDRETAEDCIRRELREELAEIGLSQELISPALQFRSVRSVEEGPEYIAAQGYLQFRIFDVLDLQDDTNEARALLGALLASCDASSDLLWVTAEQIRRGRAAGGQVIAAHSPYLFGKTRYREGDPAFPAD